MTEKTLSQVPAEVLISASQVTQHIANPRASWPNGFKIVSDEALQKYAESIFKACAFEISQDKVTSIFDNKVSIGRHEILTGTQRESLIKDICEAHPGMFKDTPHKALSKLSWAIESTCMASLAEFAKAELDRLKEDGYRWQALMNLLALAPKNVPYHEAALSMFQSVAAKNISGSAREDFTSAIDSLRSNPRFAANAP